jgi:hypothetical protein
MGDSQVDYFGEILDEITELYEAILSSPHVAEAGPVLKALMRAMVAASNIEIARTEAMDAPADRRKAAA